MPQQNGQVKQKFATLFNQVDTIVNDGKFSTYLKNGLRAKAMNTAKLLENNRITPNRNLSLFQQFFGKGKRSILSSMQTFGEMCITTYRNNIHWAKLTNQGTSSIWDGYAAGYPTWTYPVFNLKTKKIILTRDVIFYRNLTISIPRLTNLSW